MKPLALIAAYDRNRVIGRDGDLPWHHPEDLGHFKQTTLGHAIIHGRRSYESFGRPLPGRRNIVVTRNPDFSAEGCTVVHDLDKAIEEAYREDDFPFVCGGSRIYAEALPRVTRMYLTEIDETHDGDTHFPEFDEDDWEEIDRRESGVLTFRTLERRGR